MAKSKDKPPVDAPPDETPPKPAPGTPPIQPQGDINNPGKSDPPPPPPPPENP